MTLIILDEYRKSHKPQLKKSKPEKKPSPNEQLASELKKVWASEIWKLPHPGY